MHTPDHYDTGPASRNSSNNSCSHSCSHSCSRSCCSRHRCSASQLTVSRPLTACSSRPSSRSCGNSRCCNSSSNNRSSSCSNPSCSSCPDPFRPSFLLLQQHPPRERYRMTQTVTRAWYQLLSIVQRNFCTTPFFCWYEYVSFELCRRASIQFTHEPTNR